MTREEIEALLPFHVNGTLEGEEAAAVEAALAADPQLRDEVEALAAIRDTMQEDDGFSPGEIGLARLVRTIEAEAEAEAAAVAAAEEAARRAEAEAQAAAAEAARQAEARARPKAPLVRPAVWRIAAALLLAVALAQGALLTMRGDQPGYQLAGQAEADFTVAFSPGVTEPQMRLLLLDAGVEIVGGPSALGLYSLAVLDGVKQDEAYDTLSASELVESLSRD